MFWGLEEALLRSNGVWGTKGQRKRGEEGSDWGQDIKKTKVVGGDST